MSAIKQNTIEILNQLIPQLCPEEQEIFDIYSDTFYEQAISDEDHNELGDSQYFGEAMGLDSQFFLGCLITVLVEGGFRIGGKYCWKKLYKTYQKTKFKTNNPKQEKLLAKLEQALKQKAISQQQIEKLENEKNQQQSHTNDK